jgi:nitrogen regulatory protein PII
MKLVKCIIRPEKLEEVVTKLQTVATGLSVMEVRGHGAQKGHPVIYRGREYAVSLIPKIMIDIVVDDNRVDDVVKIVSEEARTGEIGDGRIFVFPIDETYHVRTGFMDLG